MEEQDLYPYLPLGAYSLCLTLFFDDLARFTVNARTSLPGTISFRLLNTNDDNTTKRDSFTLLVHPRH